MGKIEAVLDCVEHLNGKLRGRILIAVCPHVGMNMVSLSLYFSVCVSLCIAVCLSLPCVCLSGITAKTCSTDSEYEKNFTSFWLTDPAPTPS